MAAGVTGQAYTTRYAEFVCNTRFEDLTPKVIDQAKILVLDLIGVSLAGYKLMEFPRLVSDYIASLGGTAEASIFLRKGKFPAINAAFVNATCAHALDMDDGHRFGALHPAAVVIPTGIAATELVNATTRSLIAGIVAGYEVMIRVGMAINPSSLRRGFHTTGTAGVFGATATAANIMGLNQEETEGAFGLAGLQASGFLQVNHEVEGAKVKPINPARAAMAGLLSCILAQRGARGPRYILEGDDGFLRAVADEVDANLLTRNLGTDFEICNVYLKLYAACRHTHASIDAAIGALKKRWVPASEIKEIVVETYSAAIRLAGIREATTVSAARFSIPFSVALVLTKGGAGVIQFNEENVRDEKIQALAQKVKLAVGSKWEKAYPQKRGATVTIVDKERNEWSADVELAKGEPENPASWEEIYEKFLQNATLALPKTQAEYLANIIRNLEQASLEDFVSLMRCE